MLRHLVAEPATPDEFPDVAHPTTPQGMSADYIGATDPHETDGQPEMRARVAGALYGRLAGTDPAGDGVEWSKLIYDIGDLRSDLLQAEANLDRMSKARRADQDRVRELERRTAVQAEDYRQVRDRVAELEDARGPARGAFRDLVHELSASVQRGGPAPVLEAVTRLGDALGVAIPGPFVAEPQREHDGHRPALVLVDEVVPAVAERPEPTTVREALELDGHITGPIPALLPGDVTWVRGHVPGRDGARFLVARTYGQLYRRPDGDEVLLTAEGGEAVPLPLVLPYLAAVRGAEYPGPGGRYAVLETVLAAHRGLIE